MACEQTCHYSNLIFMTWGTADAVVIKVLLSYQLRSNFPVCVMTSCNATTSCKVFVNTIYNHVFAVITHKLRFWCSGFFRF